VAELLLDFSWDPQDSRTEPFWKRLFTVWFPHLTVLGCRSESFNPVTFALLSIPVNAPPRRLSLFFLENDVFGFPRRSRSYGHDLEALNEVYRAGHLERVYIPTLDYQPGFILALVDRCIEYSIPLYNTEGWQIYKANMV
jgi:hypothetical protein